jgi:lysophospholipase L1-like esterase
MTTRNRFTATAAVCAVVLVGPVLCAGELNVPPDGFTALFNGKDLTGWKGLVANPKKRAAMTPDALAEAQKNADEAMREHWSVKDGVLVFDGKGQSLCTARDYADFELYVDWKIEEGGDSGVYLRGSPQVQIWDRPVGSGGLFNNKDHPSQPLIRADKPVGEWNTLRIIMVAERVTVYLNDILVVDNVVFENYWERDKPIYPTGQIELQNHGNSLYFRNIFLREIPRQGRPAPAPPPILKQGQRVAVVGDSITEQKLYSRYIEDYLLACLSDLELQVIQLGWSGERAPGFAARLENDCLPFEPDVVTTCYGMNDGLYRPYQPSIGRTYEQAMRQIVSKLQLAGAVVAVGSPGAVDTFTFKRNNLPPAVYNDNLAHLRDIAREIARDTGMPFANVHDPMILAQLKAKPILGEAYDVCGKDGFHPRPNGHLVMAYAFLKALGVDGEIGTITVDMKGDATATDGHRVVSATGGRVEIESARYPFCFFGDEKTSESTRSILPFMPFNEELNRLTLIVSNLEAEKARVSWGEASQVFTRDQLTAGVNLAAAFLDNPFCEPFRKLDRVVAEKQAYETAMIKEGITRFRRIRSILGQDSETETALAALRERFEAKLQRLHAQARATVVPVPHTITITPE